ncbi:MAG: type II toxin-antitoxin system VapC family toxin [Chloroflexi bacterium]|nr:type II toxin-antitoxin system VapC family toxin [Chloroflexota bacterium]
MQVFFFDTSAIVKRYIDEPGSAWVRQICNTREADTNARINLVVVGSITIVEFAAAVSILERRNVILKRVAERAYKHFFCGFRERISSYEHYTRFAINGSKARTTRSS